MGALFSVDDMKGISGFTLLELMVALAVAAVLLVIAVPSFVDIFASSDLSSSASQVILSLNKARLEAIRRNTQTQFCSNSASNNGSDPLGAACGTSAGAVYVANANGSTTLIQPPLTLVPTVELGNGSNGSPAVTALRYGGNGIASTPNGSGPYNGLVADLYSLRVRNGNHRCIYMATGSVMSSCAMTLASGSCPANEPQTCQP